MNNKINETFAIMKGLRKIVIRSFFLLAFSLCLGINSYSYFNLHHLNSEISACTNIENSLSNLTDSLNDDQIFQSDNSNDSPEPFILIPPHLVVFPIHNFCFSIWQPPKVS